MSEVDRPKEAMKATQVKVLYDFPQWNDEKVEGRTDRQLELTCRVCGGWLSLHGPFSPRSDHAFRPALEYIDAQMAAYVRGSGVAVIRQAFVILSLLDTAGWDTERGLLEVSRKTWEELTRDIREAIDFENHRVGRKYRG